MIGSIKSLNMTWKDFVKYRVTDIYTWPYLPSGLLKHAGGVPPQSSIADLTKFYHDEFIEVDNFVKLFEEKQKTSISWILAALIGVIGNLAVSFVFVSELKGNMILMFLSLLIMTLLIFSYLRYLPTIPLTFRFIPDYIDFPQGYEQHIPKGSCHSTFSSLYLNGDLNLLVIRFGTLIRVALLRDSISERLKRPHYIRISNIIEMDANLPVYFITFSTKGRRIWLSSTARVKIREELSEVVQGLFEARMKCKVMGFEIDPIIWGQRGPTFIDSVSEWNMDEARKEIVNSFMTMFS